MLGKQLIQAASGSAAAGGALYVDDVFSTFLYEGNSTARSINNGIDLSGEGGLTWIKSRTNTYPNQLYDTERGAGKYLISDSNAVQATDITRLSAFNSDGFSLGTNANVNLTGQDFVSWTFRKAPGFFDVVTYTGNSSSAQTISHNLGSAPGVMIIKSTSTAENWIVYSKDLYESLTGNFRLLSLNTANDAGGNISRLNSTQPTSSVFTVGLDANTDGDNYVAYLFASDEPVFGTNSDESIIKCGTYAGNGSTTGPVIDLGFEPQWLMIKRSNSTGNWTMWDAMRGAGVPNQTVLEANQTTVEDVSTVYNVDFQATGFQLKTSTAQFNGSGDTFIYMAIRRPHKPPTAGTEVFAAQASRATSDGTASQLHFTSSFPVDLLFQLCRAGNSANVITVDRLRGGEYLSTSSTAAELDTIWKFDSMDGVYFTIATSATSDFGANMFRRAPGFFDIVAYSGTGADQVVNHNLGVIPELMIAKARSTSTGWRVFYKDSGTEKNLQLSTTGAAGNIPASHPWSPTATTFRADQYFSLSESGQTFVAYLFATLSGISKVGLYTGTGNAINVDCGFSSGARFILIKRTDATGDWFVYDSARGIVSGNDPYLLLNSTAAEVTNTDYIDPLSSGFTVTSSAPTGLNASGGTYIFLAIA